VTQQPEEKLPIGRGQIRPLTRKDMELPGPDLLPIHFSSFRGPDASQATPGVFDNLDLPAKRRLDPLDKAAFVISAIGPDQLETRKALAERREQVPLAAVVATRPPFWLVFTD
jgi:hypothetical protein